MDGGQMNHKKLFYFQTPVILNRLMQNIILQDITEAVFEAISMRVNNITEQIMLTVIKTTVGEQRRSWPL